MTIRTSGPLHIGPRLLKRGNRFGLLLSNLSGGIAQVQVQVHAAPFTGFDTPSTWSLIVDRSLDVENGSVITLQFPLDDGYAYYHFFVEDDIFQPCFHTTLYLFGPWKNTLHTLPLVKANEWEIIPS